MVRRDGIRLCSTLLFVTLIGSGCASFGYVPGYVTPKDTKSSPTLPEVRAAAFKMRDGWESRAVFNRYAGYVGGLVAAAAVGAMAGLAVFDAGNAAIKGIPIGAGFLGGVAAVYNNEPKAQIYSRAARYITGMLNSSDRRLASRTRENDDPEQYLKNLQVQQSNAQTSLEEILRRHLYRMGVAGTAMTDASTETEGPVRMREAHSVALAASKNVHELDDAVKTATAATEAMNRRVKAVEKRSTEGEGFEKRSTEADTKQPDDAEARCLVDDLNTLAATVEELIEATDPKNVAKLLTGVSASKKADAGTDSSGGTAAATKGATSKSDDKKPTLADLELPTKSTCDDDV